MTSEKFSRVRQVNIWMIALDQYKEDADYLIKMRINDETLMLFS